MRRFFGFAVVAALVLLGSAVAAASPPGWAVQHAPIPHVSNGQLNGVSCSAQTSCMAVGFYLDDSGRDAALAEFWNGTSWKVAKAANPAGAPYTVLHAVSCTSAKACIAVGDYDNSANTQLVFAERWNGTTWSVQGTPEPPVSSTPSLTGVSCASAAACVAVGTYYDLDVGADTGLSELWNGHTWVLQGVTGPADAQRTSLHAVSCPSSNDCTAVGFYTDASDATQPLAESWNGTAWQAQAAPAGGAGALLASVSCSAHDCMAVGQTGDSTGTYAQSWNGTGWQVRGTVDTAQPFNRLGGVSCSSSTACTTVGYSENKAGVARTLAERWNGTDWAVEGTPSPSGGAGPSFSDVSCRSAKNCTAVGMIGSSWRATLVVGWDGTTWKIQTTPNPDGAPPSYFASVSCSSRTACMAAGDYVNSTGHGVIFTDRLSGSHWKIELPPTVKGAMTDTLTGVSCPSAKACIAVGYSANSAETDTALAERWNGKSWKIEKTRPGTKYSAFLGVSCASATMCMAVGRPGAERWNGHSWQSVKTPMPANTNAIVLNAVSCPSTKSCTAVGAAGPLYATTSLIEHWNGSNWKVEKAANPPPMAHLSSSFALNGVSCATSTACSAVGTATYGGGYIYQYAETTSGSKWKITLSTTGSNQRDGNLVSVSCTSPSACTAVGLGAGLAERWDGHSWTIQHTPKTAAGFGDGLAGVSCVSATRCIAVGTEANSVSNVALMLRYA